MVGRECLELDRELGTPKRCQLVGVEMDAPAVSGGVGEYSACLLEIEDTLLAEHIDRLGEAGATDLRVDLFDQSPYPFLRIVAVLGWDLMGREAGRMKIDRVLSIGVADHLEHSHLGFEIEPVSRFGFDGGRPVGQKPVETIQRPQEELLWLRGTSRPHGGIDATS